MKLKRASVLLLASALLLGACGQQPQIGQHASPAAGSRQLRSLGLYELQITGVGSGAPKVQVVPYGKNLAAQEIAGLSFNAATAASYTTGQDKHLSVVVTVNNSGAAITKPTFVPVALSNYTQNNTFFRAAQDSAGNPVDPSGILVEQAVTGTGTIFRDNSATPLISPVNTGGMTFDLPAGTSVSRISDAAWQSPAIGAGSSQNVVFGVNVGANSAFRMNLVFAVFDNPALTPVPTSASSAIFSEYIDGVDNDKALEIYNGSATTYPANNLVISRFTDGSTTPDTYIIPTDLVPGATFVLANPNASAALKARANATDNVAVFNGNDGLGLSTSSSITTPIDSFGKLGENPGGGAWTGSNGVSTKGQTLRRKLGIVKGDINPYDTFDPSTEWDSVANTVYSGLGSRTDPTVVTAASSGKLSGFVFDDLNKNGVQDSGEGVLSGWTVYLDTNGNGMQDNGETSVVTASDGSFQFPSVSVPAGMGTVKLGIKNRLGYSGAQAVLGTASLHPLIINGTAADANTAPFQAFVFVANPADPNNGEQCGGSVIAPRWILTAAHCFVKSTGSAPASQVTVRVGITNLNSTSDGTPIAVEQIFNHENYNTTTNDNDIALLKLKTSVPTSIVPIIPAMPNETQLNAAGLSVRVSGYGKTEKGTTSDQLLYVDQVISTDAKCQSVWNSTANMVCAETPPNDPMIRESCQGDSGGPLFTTSGALRQVGVVSFGSSSCQERDKPGVYVRLTQYDAWLAGKTGRGPDSSITVNFSGDKSGVAIGVRQSN